MKMFLVILFLGLNVFAGVSSTVVNVNTDSGVRAKLISWSDLKSTETGEAVSVLGYSNKSVQIGGTFASGQVTIQGSNNGVSWTTLHSIISGSGTQLILNNAQIKDIFEQTVYVRPLTSGTASASINVNINVSQ